MTEPDLNERPLLPPSYLCVGGRPAPLGIQTNPVFSWRPSVGEQTGYEVQVGHTPGTADAWSPGLVESSDSVGVS